MSVILTNSYKGLIISYLAAPWEYKQDYEYLIDMSDFWFYSRIAGDQDMSYWYNCETSIQLIRYENSSCSLKFNSFTAPGSWMGALWLLNSQYSVDLKESDKALISRFQRSLHAFPRNESQKIYNRL